MRKRCIAISLLLALILLLLPSIVPVVHAAWNNRPLSSLEELLAWYAAPWVYGEAPPILVKEIIVDRQVVLSETEKVKDFGAIEHGIRVASGGSLTLNNSKLNINGPKTVIVVEPGGELVLSKGAIWGARDALTIVVEKGGRLINSGEFTIDRGVIFNKNDGNEPPIDPIPSGFPAIQKTWGSDFALSCMVGEQPALSDYPPTEQVFYETADKVTKDDRLPVKWELDTVDFETAGTYAVKGVFTAEVLAEHKLSNPYNITSTLRLTVIKPSPIDALAGNVLSVGSSGNCHIRLEMPPLPEGATALYIYRSADGQNWQKAVQEVYTNGNVPSSYDNFLPHAMITPTRLYVQYRYQTDYRPIWLRVEVVGSAAAGVSNEIRLAMPESAKPGDSVNTGETGDDGASGGNRGGGGQSEGERELPKAEEKPSESETLTIGNVPPIAPVSEEPISETAVSDGTPPPMIGAEVGGAEEYDGDTAPQGGSSESSPPVSTNSDANKEEEVTTALSLPKQETESAVEVLSAEAEGSPPFQMSRGVMLTAGATAFAGGGLLTFRKLYRIPKKKP